MRDFLKHGYKCTKSAKHKAPKNAKPTLKKFKDGKNCYEKEK